MTKFSYDFSSGEHGWEAVFADYDPDGIERYEMEHGYRNLPATAGQGMALFISGMNRSDDLFMAFIKRVDGLQPSTTYLARFEVELASMYRSRFGAGGNPAESVFVKACAVPRRPEHAYYEHALRLDIDIGRQGVPGKNAVILGDVDKGGGDKTDDYKLITRKSEKSLECISAEDGSLWLLFGTDSGYEGQTALYYTSFSATLEEVR